MERQLPKNVRQIGNVCDEPKIYVEDYVDTFLGQLQEKAMEKPVAAALAGEITKCEDQVVVYISGAIQAEDVEVEGTNLKISEEIWEKIEKEQKEYFKNQSTEDFNITDRWTRPLNVIKLSQFNKARSMLGYDEIKLKED